MNPLCLICCRIRADTVLLACWSRTQEHYSAKEAARYTGAAASVQKDLTERSLAIAGLLPSLSSPKLLLDIGCGSGLSGKVVSDAGYHWIGVDISADMLALAEQSSRAHAPGRKVAAAAGEGSSARAQRRGLCCGLALADMGRSLGVGRHSSTLSRTDQADIDTGLFDGAISISAVQWLLARDDWWEASPRFFDNLISVLVPGAMAVLQVYITREHEAVKLMSAASKAGFLACPPNAQTSTAPSTHTTTNAALHQHTGTEQTALQHAASTGPQNATTGSSGGCWLLADYPHNNAARKYSIVLQRPYGRPLQPDTDRAAVHSAGVPQQAATGAERAQGGTQHGLRGTTQEGTQQATQHGVQGDSEAHGLQMATQQMVQGVTQHGPQGPRTGVQHGCGEDALAPAHGWVQQAPECPLGWHVGGTCALWWDAHSEQVTAQVYEPGQVSVGSWASDTEALQRCQANCVTQHHAHGRRMGRMLQRAAVLAPAAPGLWSPCTVEDFSKAASQQQPVNTGRAQEHGRKVKRRRGDAVGQPAAASEPAPPHLQQQLQDQPAGMQGDDVLSQDPYKHLPQGLRQWRQRYQPHTLPHTAVTQIDTPSSSAHGQSDTASVHAPRHPGTADSPGSTEYVQWIVRATAFVHAPWLYPCGGHTHVTIETEVASVPLGCPGDELESRVRFMIAKVFGVRPEEVSGLKVEEPAWETVVQESRETPTDAYVGARVSYHGTASEGGRAEQPKVFLGTLQPPGVVPPYCVLDSVWTNPQVLGQPVKQAIDTETGHIAKQVQSLLAAACGRNERTGGMQGGQMAVTAVYLQLGIDQGAAKSTCCRLLVSLWDVTASLAVPQVASVLFAASSDAGSSGAEAPGVVKQRLAMQALMARMQDSAV